ncbi:hypothetical protein N7519_000307 [Penicillium mononematosum]|uniref:uncharacterized protein n=1 Tax=Penicillium mononematosum TaxID=268346 RepID=UPI002549242F|nr:uncharacterized protein N7519_000307 [Penicillium mononematosum]KAJ6190286.1 hypothetical protein N7519_000307 [Penicillium mononematosum]
MTRLATIFTTLCTLYSLPLISAWTFVWRNATDNPTLEKGTDAQSCKAIDHPKGKYFKFDAEDSLFRIYMYGSPNCTDDNIESAEDYLAKNSTAPLRAFAVIDLRGANTSTGGELTPFPGAEWFKSSPNSPIVTAMGERLVAEDCGKYRVGPGPQWSEVDRESYQCWQEKLGYTGTDANGWPGKITWDQLKVSLADENDGGGSSKTTETPSSTIMSTGTGTPTSTLVPDTDTSSGSPLGGGEIAGVVVGSVAGLGLIGATFYLSRRIFRHRAPASGDGEAEPDPEGGAVAAGESKKSAREKPPSEVESNPAKSRKKYVSELPGDTAAAELSDSRRILEIGDSRT